MMKGVRRAPFRSASLAAIVVAGLPWVVSAQAQEPAPVDGAAQDVQQFCTNIAVAAREQRYVIQKRQLDALKVDVDKRMKALEDRRAEYEDWLTRRNDFLKSAQESLVDIYTKMDSDAAAAQLQLMDPNIAAAIVMKLQPAKASEILNEMKPDKAAALAGIIASAGDPATSRNPS